MKNIFNDIKILKDLSHIIYNYLSKSQKFLLQINENSLNKTELVIYDFMLVTYCINTEKIDCPYKLIETDAKFGKFKYMVWLFKNCYIHDIKIETTTFAHITEYGNLDILKWLYDCGFYFSDDITFCAAKNGNLNNMKCLYEKYFIFDYNTFAFVALNGNLENMKWLLENNIINDENTFASAALNDNLDNMK